MKEINLPALIITVFIISWIGVAPGLLGSYGVEIPAGLRNLEILMTLGPIIGAIVFIFKAHGKKGLKDFFSRLLYFKASPFVLVLAIGIPVVVTLLSSVIGFRLMREDWPEAFSPIAILSNGMIIFLMYLILNTEELVWRGVVFEKLFARFGYFKSCLLLIPIWGIFHIPLFLYSGGHQAGYGIGEFSCIVVAQTFILGWIYLRSHRSLFYVHVHHQLINGFGQAFPIFPIFIGGSRYPVWVMCILLLITAGILIWLCKKEYSFQHGKSF